MFSERTIIKRNNSFNTVDMDGDLGMLNAETGRYSVLNCIAARIWNYIEEPISVGDIVRRLTDEFDVSYEVCMKDIIPFLKNLKKGRLIDVVKL